MLPDSERAKLRAVLARLCARIGRSLAALSDVGISVAREPAAATATIERPRARPNAAQAVRKADSSH